MKATKTCLKRAADCDMRLGDCHVHATSFSLKLPQLGSYHLTMGNHGCLPENASENTLISALSHPLPACCERSKIFLQTQLASESYATWLGAIARGACQLLQMLRRSLAISNPSSGWKLICLPQSTSTFTCPQLTSIKQRFDKDPCKAPSHHLEKPF